MPAHNLSVSLLRTIFSQLTLEPSHKVTWRRDPPQESPLTNLRYGSQVCRSWRAAITNAPALWGRSIDLNLLYMAANEWRTEVHRRAGHSSRLHVQAFLDQDKKLATFMKAFLSKHWDRIYVLIIEYENLPYAGWMESAWEEAMIWKIFQRPSPNLGYFSVECANCPALNFVNKFPMFSGNAPLLEYFGGTIFRIDSQATWLSQIQALRFTSPFSAEELIDILNHMPLLEALGIYDNDQNDYADDNEDEEMTDDSYREEEEDDSDLDNSSKESKKYSGLYFIPVSNLDVSTKAPHVFGATALPRVSLPRLSYISIDTRRHPGSCGKYLDILDNLTPSAKGCVLSFNSDDGIKPAIVGPAQRILRTYFENYLKLESPTEMLLFIRNNSVSIKVSQKFAFDIGFTEKIHSAFVAGFLNALSSFSFVKIKDLIFAVEHGGDIVQSMDPAASRVMFSSLDALESLRTSAPILQHLLTIPRSSATGVIFPSLTRLILVQISETSGLEQSVLRAFFQNIKSKFELAPQAADFCLDLYAPANELKNCDLRFLEEYDGLKVIWGDRPFLGRRKEMKYVCGSGNPEVLNFKIQKVA